MAISLNPFSGGFNAIILIRIQSFARASRYMLRLIMFMYHFISIHVHPFWIQFFYFIIIDLLGSLLLMVLKPTDPDFSPRYVDMFFLSTSALTVSGLSTVAMERLSSSQIVVFSLLMLVGGEVFVSMLCVFCRSAKSSVAELTVNRVNSVRIELETIDSVSTVERIESGTDISVKDFLRRGSLKYLGLVIVAYWVFFHVTGFIACLVYLFTISSSKEVLRGKGINLGLFAFSTTVSSFANGGLIATNENMAIFVKNSGLLLFQIVLVLAGNTLFPVFLRGTIWVIKCFTKNEELDCMIKSPKDIKFDHLLTNLGTFFRSITVLGMIAFVTTLFCAMDWRHPVFSGLNSYQKIVAALFMGVNARHAGENSVDPSLISPAVLLFIIFMMYLPSSATFLPLKEDEEERSVEPKENSRGITIITKILLLPQVVCVIIFVIVACIIERRRLQLDPLNFSALNVIFEVVSAYGNVGISTGYACSRLQKLHPDMSCVDQPYSFAGWWSDGGKLLIAFVMLYGRLKKFSEKNGKAWTLKG
ncbi:High-affinity potassium transporter [Rhynchospora pubera]|uniref:High-affinity potassium transporter n=2 Tax=Rhynchospora pubera TaxID=906938 RepID=A0AAV8HJE4_9POAL|nr:High-affinity potassium transporter [Rhynchospora pubera]